MSGLLETTVWYSKINTGFLVYTELDLDIYYGDKFDNACCGVIQLFVK